ncbi:MULTISPECIES: type II toxin-antitoxin system PemK/MazF family toxin [Streptomyces]|uniref:type II toxin-antitoxin system PemK/MazF family toxin n=1 Tax=Streptomyces TaxID=1883 RepID=UPI0033E25C11
MITGGRSRLLTGPDQQHYDLWLEQAAAEGAPRARRPVSGGHMRRGEVWWADFDEQRAVVLLSGEEASGFLAMQVVAPAGADLSGVAVEVAVGASEGLPLEGVLRVALPRPDLIPCTWLVTLAREDLIGQAGVLPSAKLSEIEEALRLGGLK